MKKDNLKNETKPLQQQPVMPLLFSVSLLFKKKELILPNRISEEDGLCGRVLWATSEEEAFGLAYNSAQDKYKNWQLASKVTFEIPKSLINGA